MNNEAIEDALCDMYDIRERSKVHKFDVLAKDGDGTDTTIGDCIKNVIDDKSIEPTDPAIVLFGLIFDNFGPLKNLPNTKPPTSEAIQVNNKMNKNILK